MAPTGNSLLNSPISDYPPILLMGQTGELQVYTNNSRTLQIFIYNNGIHSFHIAFRVFQNSFWSQWFESALPIANDENQFLTYDQTTNQYRFTYLPHDDASNITYDSSTAPEDIQTQLNQDSETLTNVEDAINYIFNLFINSNGDLQYLLDNALITEESDGERWLPQIQVSDEPASDYEIATKHYVDQAFQANNAMIFKGTLGTGGTVTALPAEHYQGWTYRVITAGQYAGKQCEIGDIIICITDGTAANNDHWTVVQTNIDGAVTGPASATANAIATFNGTTGKIIQNSAKTLTTTAPTSGSTDSTIPTSKAVWSAISAADTKVTQNAAITTNGEYPIILGNSTATTAITDTVNKTSTLTYNPSTQILTTPNLSAGNIYVGSSSYGSELPASGTTGQIFFQDDEYSYATQGDLADFVSGPDGATENGIAIYNGVAGNVIKNTGVTIDSSNNIDTAGNLTAKNLYVFGSNTSSKTNRFITSDSATNVYFSIDGVTPLVVGKTELRTGNSVTSGTINLGSTGRRWKNVYAATVDTTKISIPTTAGGSTYGVGSAGQVITSDGTNTYWATPNQDDVLVYNNIAVTTNWQSNTTNTSIVTDYPYQTAITCTGTTSNYVPTVIFDYAQLTENKYAPYAVSAANTVYIYANNNTNSTITIPTIYCVKGSNTITN